MRMRWGIVFALAIGAAPAAAQDRDYCPARPGLGDTACTIDAGRVSVEIGAVDWQRDGDAGARADTMTLADTLVRVGLGHSTEADIGWTPHVQVRSRDASGAVERAAGVGDLTLAVRQNLHAPDGKGLAVAVAPYVTLPTGSGPGGAGDWGAGMVLPASLDLGRGLELQSTGALAAAPDVDRQGRHAMASEVIGLGIALTDRLSATVEGQLVRDWDPVGAMTQAYGGLALAFATSRNLQLDVGAVAGLDHQAADVALHAGISRRF